jgi:carboxymethylenebutenolidase
MATNDLGTAASVMYYGQFDPEDDFANMRAHILGHFGQEDTGIAVDTVREFQAALETANGMHEVYIYPNVGHGFANARGGTNMAYNQEAAELAWDRTQAFLLQVFSR